MDGLFDQAREPIPEEVMLSELEERIDCISNKDVYESFYILLKIKIGWIQETFW